MALRHSLSTLSGVRNILIHLGENCIAATQGLGDISILFAKTVRSLFRRWPRAQIILEQMQQVGIKSIPVILTTGTFVGMVLAVQTYYQFRRLHVETMLGAVVGMSMVKELGPVLVGLMLAGRVGAAITAELGTMRVTEQIDALEALATDPVKYLILPRVMACILLTPILTVFADVVGMIGGYVVAVELFHVNSHFYLVHTFDYVTSWGIGSGLIKSSFFGGLIAMVCCYKGFTTKEGAEGVGRATTESVVTACILILITDFFLTVLMG